MLCISLCFSVVCEYFSKKKRFSSPNVKFTIRHISRRNHSIFSLPLFGRSNRLNKRAENEKENIG